MAWTMAGATIEPIADEAEYASEHLVGDDPLQEGENGDILDAVRGADDREQEERRGEVGMRCNECDRNSPEHEG